MAKGGLLNQIKKLPLLVKLILCLPVLSIFWGVYRLVKNLSKGRLLLTIISILLIVPGAAFMWIVDAIFILLSGEPFLC